MSERALTRAIRHTKRKNRLGNEAFCESCELKDHEALRQVGKWVLCVECHLRKKGKSIYEFHHVAGEANSDFKIRIPANAHAWLSDAQYDWPRRILRNNNDDLLLKMSAMMRGSCDVFSHILQKLPEYAVEIEHLQAYLTEKEGEDWIMEYQQWREQKDG